MFQRCTMRVFSEIVFVALGLFECWYISKTLLVICMVGMKSNISALVWNKQHLFPLFNALMNAPKRGCYVARLNQDRLDIRWRSGNRTARMNRPRTSLWSSTMFDFVFLDLVSDAYDHYNSHLGRSWSVKVGRRRQRKMKAGHVSRSNQPKTDWKSD